MTIAAAQTIPNDGNIEANISDHCRLAEAAAKEGAQLILFPEMSLTGYQRERAGELAFFEHDARLQRLRNVATNRAITIVAGAPIRMVSGLHIGAFIIAPGKSVSVYTKQYLHDGEAAFFTTSSGNDAQIKIANELISLAICADIADARHAAQAAASGSAIYAPGMFYTPGAMDGAYDMLSGYARRYAMNMLMANFGGRSWGMEAGGRSGFWQADGILKGSLGSDGEGLLIAVKTVGKWSCRTHNTI